MLFFVDCETTGLLPCDNVVQLAFIVASDTFKIIKAHNYFFSVKEMPEDAHFKVKE